MPVLNWVRFSEELSWDQVGAAATAAGGRLYIDDHDPASGANWPQGLAAALDDSVRYETPSWFGISAIAGGGYRWVDGRTVDPAWAATRFGPGGDPNGDADPSNDATHLVLAGNTWRSPAEVAPDGASQAFIEYTNSKSVRGTAFDDAFFGGGGPGETLRTGDGNDSWIGTGGGKVYLGAGDDFASVRELEFTNEWVGAAIVDGTTIFDGFGRDRVEAESAVVRAAIDGEADQFIARRVSYTDATLGVTIVPVSPNSYRATVADAGGGTPAPDSLTTVEVVGGPGDDHIEGVPRVQGGAGNDYLAPGINALSQSPYAEGDAGNDTLVGSSAARTELRGGPGDDMLIFHAGGKASGGAGIDSFVVEAPAPVTLNDWTPGERLDLSGLTSVPVAELFSGGFLAIQYKSGYTNLLFDADGGGDGYAPLLNFKGSFSQIDISDWVSTGAAGPPLQVVDAYFRASPNGADAVLALDIEGGTSVFKPITVAPSAVNAGTQAVFDAAQDDIALVDLDLFGSGSGAIAFTVTDGSGAASGSLPVLSAVLGPAQRVSTDSAGAQANSFSGEGRISDDGRFVVFSSAATNLMPDATVGNQEIFRKDLFNNQVTLVSSGAGGEPANNFTFLPDISADGRYVIFTSFAANLVSNDTNGSEGDVFRKDLLTGDIVIASTNSAGVQPFRGAAGGAISADGRFVAFATTATDLDANATDGQFHVFLKDLATGELTLVDLGHDGRPPNAGSDSPQLSGDGRFVVFQSGASNLVAGDDDGVVDIFVKDMVSGAVTLVAAPGFPPSADPGISADGRFVAFASSSPDLVDNDTNNCSDVFVKDLFAGGLTRISIGDSGLQGNADSFAPQISGNGRYVTFTSIASNLAAGDTRDSSDAFRKDLVTGELTLISTDRAGQPAGRSFAADVASNGWVVMGSVSSNLVVGDTNNQPDVFLYRSGAVTGGSGAELLRGGASADSMDGGAGRDLLLGGLGDDSLTGGAGDDELAGGPGRDVLVGGGGNDRFVLATPDAGPDTVSDFDPSADTLVVFAAEFGGGLVPGAVLLTPPQTTGNLFVASSDPFATTLNSSSAFLYDTDDGRLWFDPDGSGAQAAVLMATLVSAPAITSSDFLFA